ncbi:MAG: endonuclease/exonuclease/phosphatase family protein [Candidatus Heimdallarchaeaceae archaeon]
MNKKLIILLSGAALIVLATTIPLVIIFTGETDPPTMTNLTPIQYEIVSGVTEISFEAIDTGENPSGMGSYKIYINDVIVTKENIYDWDTTQYEDGSVHKIRFEAYDKKRNRATREIFVTVDNIINPAPTDVFKVLSYNIWESGKMDEYLDVIIEENPDIAVLVETGGLDDGKNRQLIEICNRVGGYYYKQAPFEGRADQLGATSHSTTNGEAIISRYPILDFLQIDTWRTDAGPNVTLYRDFFDAVIDINGVVTHVIGYHGKCCSPTVTTNTTEMRETEAELMINYVDDLGDVPVMVLGDFNSHSPDDVGDLAPMGWLGDGPLRMWLRPDDPNYGHLSSKVHNFTDVYRELYPDELGFSFGYWEPQYWGRIDFILVNEFWADRMINATVGDTPSANLGSDHYSVDVFLSLDEDYSYFNGSTIAETKNPVRVVRKNMSDWETNELVESIITFNKEMIALCERN